MNVFHYTSGRPLLEILKSGQIEPSVISVAEHEIPAVWLTTSPAWDDMANKPWRDAQSGRVEFASRDLTEQSGGGLVRICIIAEAASFPWQHYKAVGGITAEEAEAIERHAVDLGSNPADWWASFSSIGISEFLDIELWHHGRWKSVVPLLRRPVIGRRDAAAITGRIEIEVPLVDAELEIIQSDGIGNHQVLTFLNDAFERDACPRGVVFGILEDLVHGECAAGFGSDIINGRQRVMLVADYS